MGYSPWGHQESYMTKGLTHTISGPAQMHKSEPTFAKDLLLIHTCAQSSLRSTCQALVKMDVLELG